MPADGDAVRRWAAAHASTLATPDRGSARELRRPPPEPVEARLSSFTQAAHCNVGWTPTAVAMGKPRDGTLTVVIGGSTGSPMQIWKPYTGHLDDAPVAGVTKRVFGASWGRLTDGRPVVATTDDDGVARIWDPESGETVSVLTGHQGLVYDAAWGYRPDGQPLLATAGHGDDDVRIWEPLTGAWLHTISLNGGAVWSVAWAQRADGRLQLIICCATGAQIWDLNTAQLVPLHENTQARSASCGYQPDGRPILAVACGNTASVWREDDGGFARDVLSPTLGSIREVRWAPISDGRMLLAMSGEDAVQVWDGHTLACLHSETLNFHNTGLHHLDWMVEPDGRLLLAAGSNGGEVHLWEVVLDPPVQPPATPLRDRAARDRVRLDAVRPVTILDPPEDVTPDFPDAVDSREAVARIACTMRADGHLMAAAMSEGRQASELKVWDLSTGTLDRSMRHGNIVGCAAWGADADGRQLLATGAQDRTAGIWDPDTGQLLRTLNGHSSPVWSVACTSLPDGQPLLATGNSDNTVRICDADTGQLLRTLTEHTGGVLSVAWTSGPDGQPLLATGGNDGTARIWDPDTGQLLRTLTEHTGRVSSVAWASRPDGQPLLATGGGDGTARIWDPDTGQLLRTLTGHTGDVWSVAWASRPDGQPLLATGGGDGTARIWDPDSGAQLLSVPSPSAHRQSVALTWDTAGDLLLVVASFPARVWRIATGPAVGREGAVRDLERSARRGSVPTRSLLRLGGGGLWPPLGLLADLIELTGPAASAPAYPGDDARPAGRADDTATPDGAPPSPAVLCDPRLAALAAEPGIARLRALDWAPAARVSLAAVLASRLAIPEQYTPPPGLPLQTLRDALALAVTGHADPADKTASTASRPDHGGPANLPGPVPGWRAPISDLRTAAAKITDRTITLLQILGPAACAADPLLPVRLAHRIPQLPALTPRELRLLDAASRPTAASRGTASGTLVYSPGTAGLARTGPLTRLLPTQLALPRDLLTIRLAENQLLYRQHRAPAPPAPEPVTIILDTTPPTYGPAGTALRLAAHLITTTLWDHDRYPRLITLSNPAVSNELRTSADLLGIWSGATLDDPAAALTIALTTAAQSGLPTVLATHLHTASDSRYPLSAATRLLTAHHPPEQPPPPPASPWHAHLPPSPSQAQLAAAIGTLLYGRHAEGR
jgi:WD40 repeat protein